MLFFFHLKYQTFDDGPLNPRKAVIDQSPDGIDEYAEPYLYDFLADQNQRATLFCKIFFFLNYHIILSGYLLCINIITNHINQ